jgi:hypothetical protein
VSFIVSSTENAMAGIHADWFADPKTLRIILACTLALALAVRVLASVLVKHLLRINRRKRNFRYRIPLALAHPARANVRENRRPISRVPPVVAQPPLGEALIAKTPQGNAEAMADGEKP